MVKSVEELPKEKNKCVVQAAQRDWKSQFATLGTFDGLSLMVFATGKPLKVCEPLSVHCQNGGMDDICSVGTYTTHLSSLGFSKKRDYNYKKQHSLIRPHS